MAGFGPLTLGPVQYSLYYPTCKGSTAGSTLKWSQRVCHRGLFFPMTSVTAQKKLKIRVGGDDFINQVPWFCFSPSNRNPLVYGILTWAITRNLIPLEFYNFSSYHSRIPKTLKTKVGWLVGWLIYRSNSSGNKTYSDLNLLGAKIWLEWTRGCLQAPFTQPRLIIKIMCWICGSTQTLLVMACSTWYIRHVTFQKPKLFWILKQIWPQRSPKRNGSLVFFFSAATTS